MHDIQIVVRDECLEILADKLECIGLYVCPIVLGDLVQGSDFHVHHIAAAVL